MTRSVFFRRILSLLFFTIFLSAVLTSLLFYLISRKTFYQQKTEDLMDRANSSVQLISLYDRGAISYEDLISLLERSNESNLFYYDAEGNRLFFVAPEGGLLYKAQTALQYDEIIAPLLPEVYGDKIVQQVVDFDRGQLIIGMPVYTDTADPNMPKVIVGALFMCTSMDDVNAARDSLYLTLMLSMMIVSLVTLAVATVVSRSISRPVTTMRDVADSMARGNFVAQADESQPLELGELAHSLNFLSNALSQTISDLVLERNRLQQILDGLSEGILALNHDGEITQINPAMEHFFGPLDPENASPQDYIEIDGLWDDFDIALKQNCNVTRTFKWRDRIMRVDISPIMNSLNLCVGTVGLFHDVTEAERLEQTRKDYVANVSHELKTPVSAIMSLSETLHDGMIKKPEDQQRYYGYLLHESQRLSRLIDDLLELSRLQSGNTSISFNRFDMGELLNETAERYAPVMKERGIELKLQVDNNCPWAYSNEDRIEQILVVLLDNASKFTPKGGEVKIQATCNEEKITIGVIDNGVGIASEDLSHVFDRFYKADKSHSGSGTGLGLSISKELITLMGEKIWVISKPGEGAQFFFTVQRYHPVQTRKSENEKA